MTRKLVLALLALAALFVLTGCVGGGGSSPVQQALACVTGIVSKFRGERIQGATVTLKETGQSTTTNQQGEFRMGTSYRWTTPNRRPRTARSRGRSGCVSRGHGRWASVLFFES
jgi:hypothetical protein